MPGLGHALPPPPIHYSRFSGVSLLKGHSSFGSFFGVGFWGSGGLCGGRGGGLLARTMLFSFSGLGWTSLCSGRRSKLDVAPRPPDADFHLIPFAVASILDHAVFLLHFRVRTFFLLYFRDTRLKSCGTGEGVAATCRGLPPGFPPLPPLTVGVARCLGS